MRVEIAIKLKRDLGAASYSGPRETSAETSIVDSQDESAFLTADRFLRACMNVRSLEDSKRAAVLEAKDAEAKAAAAAVAKAKEQAAAARKAKRQKPAARKHR